MTGDHENMAKSFCPKKGMLMGPYPLPVFNPCATIYSILKVFFGGGYSVFASFLGKIFPCK
jgi:hypothetical protein